MKLLRVRRQDQAGAASGINNAVARVAGVLAIAILGIIIVSAFGSRLHQSLIHAAVPVNIVQQLQANSSKLGGLQVPEGVEEPTRGLITEAIRRSFVFGFRIVMMICASLAIASAVIAWLSIGSESHGQSPGLS